MRDKRAFTSELSPAHGEVVANDGQPDRDRALDDEIQRGCLTWHADMCRNRGRLPLIDQCHEVRGDARRSGRIMSPRRTGGNDVRAQCTFGLHNCCRRRVIWTDHGTIMLATA